MAVGISSPATHHDIVNDLLRDYGNSFGENTPPMSCSPRLDASNHQDTTMFPPRSSSVGNKALDAFQRMDAKFQLREHEEPPRSPTPSGSDSEDGKPRRKRIVSLSLSRDSRPPSLVLTKSNGSTATIPPSPAPDRANTFPSYRPDVNDEPPLLPTKSVRRPGSQPAGGKGAKSDGTLSRTDSLLSQGEIKTLDYQVSTVSSDTLPVKRKPLPLATHSKFRSLVEMYDAPRGRKGAPSPPPPVPRDASVDSRSSVPSLSDASTTSGEETGGSEIDTQSVAASDAHIPPMPADARSSQGPSAAQNPFASPTLASPRSAAPLSPRHVRGKSSTGFHVLKTNRAAPSVPEPSSLITPERTPSPSVELHDDVQNSLGITVVSPMPQSKEARPFSFEVEDSFAHRETPELVDETSIAPTPALPLLSPSKPKSTPQRESPSPPTPSPTLRPSTAPLYASAPSGFPSPTPHLCPSPKPRSKSPRTPRTPKDHSPSPSTSTSTSPHFAPLTQQPIPLPLILIPRITPTQLHCYTSHATSIWSNNVFQPLGCMVCHENGRDRKWACTWCQLRVCRGCARQLCEVWGRDLGRLLEARAMEVGTEEGEGKGEASQMERSRPEIVVCDFDADVDACEEMEYPRENGSRSEFVP